VKTAFDLWGGVEKIKSNSKNIMILYKHLSINKFTINSLEENYIWFSSHENFNDPYDCKGLD
jgi:hypothetical protein